MSKQQTTCPGASRHARKNNCRRPPLAYALVLALLTVALPAGPAAAHVTTEPAGPLVIDSDMGLDDVLTLSLALQAPTLDIRALVISEGVSEPAQGLAFAKGLLVALNRTDVTLYAAADRPLRPPPAFRKHTAQALSAAFAQLQLPGFKVASLPAHRPFSAAAYRTAKGAPLTVLALGPLTNLAAALQAEPALARRLARVVFAGQPEPQKSWNTARDPQALAQLQSAGVPLEFVIKGPGGRKPANWAILLPGSSLATRLWSRVLHDKSTWSHYVKGQPLFTDELGLLYLLSPQLFAERQLPRLKAAKAVHPRRSAPIVAQLLALLRQGRQLPAPVAADLTRLDGRQLSKEVAARKASLIERHGLAEWRAGLLQNELHQHLGAYSIIGVKMGLYAAELLNAPPHGLQVISHSGAKQPVSCLDDGVMVATGATVGRRLFVHQAGAPASSTKVTFVATGRRLTLELKPSYQEEIAASIAALVKAHGNSSPAYWEGVRQLGLRIWHDWHRSEIFTAGDAK